MAPPDADQKKRPPPINIPSLSLPQPVPPPNALSTYHHGEYQQQRQQQQQQQQHPGQNIRNNPTQERPHSSSSTSLASPLEQDGPRPLHTDSSKSRTSAMIAMGNLVDQGRFSPRKSDQESKVNSQRGSTGRSRQSAAAAQAQLEALDDTTTNRAKIESRTERNLFKMTGQIPPTPTDVLGFINEDIVYIRTEDLRAQCRAVSEGKQPEQEESSKSPKKRLFSNLRNPFTKTSSNVSIPPMPSKAAQVLGTSARKPHIVQVRPIKPARPLQTAVETSRTDIASSLPEIVVDPDSRARRHHPSDSVQRLKSGMHKTSGNGNQVTDSRNALLVPRVNFSFESASPPTPPAKDTPPDPKFTAALPSPLRHVAPSQDLRESYEAYVDKGMRFRFPAFALSPSPSRTGMPQRTGTSPTKFHPYTAEDYTKLIAGEAVQWPFPEGEDASVQEDGKRDKFPPNASLEALHQARPERQSHEHDSIDSNDRRHLSLLAPRFYSPSNRSFRFFADGETPSKNTDTSRLLFSVPSNPNPLGRGEDSNNGSIEMVFQGDANDIGPQSPTSHLIPSGDLGSRHSEPFSSERKPLDCAIHEAGSDIQQEVSPHKDGTPVCRNPDQSSSRLTDLLSAVGPYNGNFRRNFEPHCPSAVPSPLHKMPIPLAPAQPVADELASFSSWANPQTPKSIDDHFFMTNEHLDVVGKTTWDLLEMFNQRQLATVNARQDQVMALVEKHAEDFKFQASRILENADDAAEKHNKMHKDLDQITTLIKNDIAHAMTVQDKKTSQMEGQIKELHVAVQRLHKLLEQKPKEVKTNQSLSSEPFSTLNSGPTAIPLPAIRSQPALAGYYGNVGEIGRDGQPPMYNNRSVGFSLENHNDGRGAYTNAYAQLASSRPGYSNRHNRDPYAGTNPYHFTGMGALDSAYTGGSMLPNFTPSSPEQHRAFNQGTSK